MGEFLDNATEPFWRQGGCLPVSGHKLKPAGQGLMRTGEPFSRGPLLLLPHDREEVGKLPAT
ncbi:hypothetical protein BN77_1955 [Rhizobium mesoamericanum STM3625]|uniref:Uncharacterized protein n=1 Tax=Rhizobium mesoamericanum STM3625 TaxID=1211777 RepID=K0PTW0_9HYPH|nr:hypothetical protein BN77_1955 [Rhizobium mesoamericanum STM3625]